MCVHFVLESKCKIDGNNEATDTEALFFFCNSGAKRSLEGCIGISVRSSSRSVANLANRTTSTFFELCSWKFGTHMGGGGYINHLQ